MSRAAFAMPVSRMLHSYPKIAAVLLGCVVSGAMLLAVEGVFAFLSRSNELREDASEWMFEDDAVLGYKPRAGLTVSSKKTLVATGEVSYDVVYEFDAAGRRETPFDRSGATDGAILYFGGSFTFGEGVPGDQTLPAHVAELNPGYRPYNYGFRGYGPQQMLAHLSRSEIREEVVGGGRAVLVYLFIDPHVLRAIGSMRTLRWGVGFPRYLIDEKDELVKAGTLTSGRPLRTLLFRVMRQSRTFRFWGVDFPRVSEEDMRLTARIVGESKKLFGEKFKSEEFVVVLYPGSAELGERLAHRLDAAGIRCLDYSGIPLETLPHDPHPTAATHRKVAERLGRDLGLSD